jgi:hypothetical protein
MSKLEAIKNLPGNQKITLSRIFDGFIKDYETGSGNNDPGQWFINRKTEIEIAAIKAGIVFSQLDPDMADFAYAYYMEA